MPETMACDHLAAPKLNNTTLMHGIDHALAKF